MSTTIIVVDTNMIVRWPSLRSEGWVRLFDKKSDWDLRFIAPSVVEMESVKVVRRNWRKIRDRVVALKVDRFGATSEKQSMLAAIHAGIDGYETELRNRLSELGADIVDPPESINILALASRAADRRAPYGTVTLVSVGAVKGHDTA